MFQVFDNSKATSAKVDSNYFNDIRGKFSIEVQKFEGFQAL